ncbi:MAG TPA: hypothetical protein VK357_01990 [Rubrobacteraceae bacterium]|nr:hypothetical protein [Rubrobacteraceae bacterium]
MRRLVAILAVGAIMATTLVGGPSALLGGMKLADPVVEANAQTIVGAPTCGPWQQARYVSASGWPYFWWWRWCINYSEGPAAQWYVDWAGWEWG